jgi:hypothetical protein
MTSTEQKPGTTLVERLRDRRYIGQEAMREEAASVILSLQGALKEAETLGRVLIQAQHGQPSASLQSIFPEVFDAIRAALSSSEHI